MASRASFFMPYKNLVERKEYNRIWGLNHPSYHKEYIKKHPDYMKNYMKKRLEENPTYKMYYKIYQENYRNEKMFGGNRIKVLERDGFKCVKCGMTNEEHKEKFKFSITIDHIDGNGRYSEIKNNSIINLQTLCLPCHGKKDNNHKMDTEEQKNERL